jgi:integrase
VVQVDEAMRLLAALPPDVSVLARGALYTGMRLGELTALKVEDVSGSTVTVQHGKGRGGGKMRVIPLTEEGHEFFAGLCEGKKRTDAVFVPVYRVKLSRAFAEACKEAKIDPPVTMHDMRRSYGSLLINSGAPADIIQELLGHADLRMTRRVYAHLLQGTLKAAVDKHLPSFTGKAKLEAAENVSKPAKRRKRATKTT